MPIYEFQCQSCFHKFETLSRSGDVTPECPQCGSSKVKKLLSSFGFKGKAADGTTTSSSSSGCAGCSGGSCSTCH
ncbi:MAG: zinc ribbon domain-containing protein [Firmicutes bacterium]|nr:zinc ribbon domain-containing protein [Bacillota bacterium]